ncbi:MAG: class I SAM-dependent methyltransferase [Burkholderiales bacterium]
MTVVEIWPGGGWYTEILAPVLRAHRKFHVARFALKARGTPDFRKEVDASYGALLAGNPDVYGKVVSTELEAPEFANNAPAGSADVVLSFRNVHNWRKPGMISRLSGVSRCTQAGRNTRRGRASGQTWNSPSMIRTGYMTEAYVIEIAEKAGFKLAAKSETNANPKDTKDHPKGVWTPPPSLRLGDNDRDKYLAIGESDRMTLKFVKPK